MAWCANHFAPGSVPYIGIIAGKIRLFVAGNVCRRTCQLLRMQLHALYLFLVYAYFIASRIPSSVCIHPLSTFVGSVLIINAFFIFRPGIRKPELFFVHL